MAVLTLPFLYLIAAWILIQLPMPEVPKDARITQEQAKAEGMTIAQDYSFEPYHFKVRDGAVLKGARYVAPSPHTLLFVHGASGHSSQLNRSIGLIQDRTGMEVFTYDHRGHGASPGRRGHLGLVGQYESDLSDVLETMRKLKPEGLLILAGHSMGGGIVQLYAMKNTASLADAYLLFAPVVGMDFPNTTPPDHIRVHTARILGVMMIQKIGIQAFSHLPVVHLGLPRFPGHMNHYSLNAVLSMRPLKYTDGISHLSKPTLLILGESDAPGGAPVKDMAAAFKSYSEAEILMIRKEHHHVQNHPEAISAVEHWFHKLLPGTPQL